MKPSSGLAAVGLSAALVLGSSGVSQAGSQPPIEERLAEHKGAVVVLNFWAAWCGPCKEELPLLARLQREYAERGVVFVGASTDAPEERDRAEALLAKSKVDYAIWYGLSEQEMRPLGLGGALPASAIFDRDGTEAFRLIGAPGKKRLVERLEWLLGGRQNKRPKELWLPAGIDASDYAR